MVKENPYSIFSLAKHNHLFIKFAISFLLLGLVFRLLTSDSISVVEIPPLSQAESPPLDSLQPPQSSNPDNKNQTTLTHGECDLFSGDWIRDDSGPVYDNRSCLVIEGHQNCMRNGRPDSDYLYWRWKPAGCDLAKFDPERFLNLMRSKSWAFIGDSISRNHIQSLLCILSQVDEAIEIYHDKEYRSKRWHFPAHNFTLSVIWSPFLLKADIFEDQNGVSSSEIQLNLDKLDVNWTDQYKNYDYVVISGGKWFLKTAIYHENNTVTGCHYCPGKNLTDLGFEYAYRKAMNLILDFMIQSDHKAFILLRTTTPDHFENGEWFSGGTCNRTIPFKEGEIQMADVDRIMREIELEEFEKAVELGSEKGVILKLLDTTRLSLLRPDGHPGLYRQFHPFGEKKNAQVQNDCLHWCLPGPIDSWNDLVMQMIST
ncbi:TRICHOME BIREFRINGENCE-LIKE 25 [Euphorbia peplus]|nr:TRICHOME BIREFRINGENCE-LIKE 25 [Euphorbia peplus]